jgi:uncharacterized protein YyaL (SSP411 family)
MSNQLASEPSLYLQQHADQTVEWMTWSEEAFNKAERQDKPLLISIGYSACHWCQEMSRNCFDDPYIAKLMNRHFVCILIDREERPDLDHAYMEAVMMFNQSAGWPLNVFCLPDGSPFWGGTYFPKEDEGHDMAPWPHVLVRVAEHYRNERGELIENAHNVIANLKHSNNAESSKESSISPTLFISAAKRLCSLHDEDHGGFGPAPKFPSPMKLDFLLSLVESQTIRENSDLLKQIKNCLKRTLNSLGQKGIFDQVGGGFFRYSRDKEWTLPHFEKMLTDNALLLSTFSRAYREFRDENHAIVARKILEWLNGEMGSPTTGFGSSVSADTDGVEGAYYLWDQAALKSVLGNETGELFYNSLPVNFKNLKLPQFIPNKLINEQDQLSHFEKLKASLTDTKKPILDEKRILSANALTIIGIVEAGISLGQPSLIRDAYLLENWISENMLNSDFSLQCVHYPTRLNIESFGTLDDYAYYAKALLSLASVSELIEPSSSANLIKKSSQITQKAFELFKDVKSAGYYLSDRKLTPPPPTRKKVWHDKDTPAGNSILINVLSWLNHLREEEDSKYDFSDETFAYAMITQNAPDGTAHALRSLSEEAIGLLSIHFPTGSETFLAEKLGEFPIRPFFLRPHTHNSLNYELRIGDSEKVWKFEELDDLLKFLKN